MHGFVPARAAPPEGETGGASPAVFANSEVLYHESGEDVNHAGRMGGGRLRGAAHRRGGVSRDDASGGRTQAAAGEIGGQSGTAQAAGIVGDGEAYILHKIPAAGLGQTAGRNRAYLLYEERITR